MATEQQLLFDGVVLGTSVLQATFGFLLLRQYSLQKNWGLNWLSVAMIAAALTNVSRLALTGSLGFTFPFPIAPIVVEFIAGFLSLSSLFVGTLIYTQHPVKHPLLLTLGLAVLFAVVTIGIIMLGWRLGGRIVTIVVFIVSGVYAFNAHQREPNVGFKTLAYALLSYPVVVTFSLLVFNSLALITPIAAVVYCTVGALMLSIVLGRRTKILNQTLRERDLQRKEINELNETLENRVTQRTEELSNAVNELQQTQAQLIQSEKLAALGSLVAGVAHELNTPIGSAYTMATALVDQEKKFSQLPEELLTRSAFSDFKSDVREGAQIIERNLHRAGELVKSFKQVAVDQGSYQKREIELHGLMNEIILTLKPELKKRNATVDIHISAGIRMQTFPGALSQVVINLVMNAMIHGFSDDKHGTITISAELTEDASQIALSIKDNGVGIPLERQPRIFDPFFTTRLGQGSSGLGLHILYNLITGLLGGRVNVYSSPGQGAEFILTLPIDAPEIPENQSSKI